MKLKCKKWIFGIAGGVLLVCTGTYLSQCIKAKNVNPLDTLSVHKAASTLGAASCPLPHPDSVRRQAPLPASIPARYLTKDFLLGKIPQRKDSAFVFLSPEHTPYKLHLLKETYQAFIKMYEAAKKDGVELKVISAARTYNDQCAHWSAKWEKLELDTDIAKTQYLLRYCALPGISRHHWGTEIDLNNLKLAYWNSPTGKKVYEWLQKHANAFGFYQPYTPKEAPNRGKGFYEEKWHWSYRPLSEAFLSKYNELVVSSDLKGFKGDYTVKDLDLAEWINSINPDLIEKK